MLEPITPEEAVEAYLNSRKGDLTELSLQNHGYRLQRFLEWCEEKKIVNMNEMTGRSLHEYANWRAQAVKQITLKTQLDTLRVFLQFCEDIEAVVPDLSKKVPRPDLDYHEEARNDFVTPGEADAIISHLEKFEYASFQHVLFYLLWHTGIRTGTVRALDIDDYHSDGEYIEIVHRPKTDTPLKNKHRARREINLKHELCTVIDDYLKWNRPTVKDEHGRKPLLATRCGRASKVTIRRNIYAVTRPCISTENCPHDREIAECEAALHPNKASQCPSSLSPHSIRRGAITYHLNQNVPMKVVSARMDVSQEVLEKHYDQRTRKERREQRQSFLINI